MVKPDDSSLNQENLIVVEKRAIEMLHKADVWDRFPTPVDDVLAAAKLRVARSSSIFDDGAFAAYIADKTKGAVQTLKTALSKVFGLYDADDEIIHIDSSVVEAKQTFLKLHETGHHQLPAHKKIFRFFQECKKTLDPGVADLFEREANTFARFVLFQHDTFEKLAADMPAAIKSPITLSKKFGASVYASCREYARTHHRSCVLYVLEPLPEHGVHGQAAEIREIRRIEASAKFLLQFGQITDTIIDYKHPLWTLLPRGNSRMRGPTEVFLVDKNGIRHRCIGEAFKTTYNVFLLVFPQNALTSSIIWMPG